VVEAGASLTCADEHVGDPPRHSPCAPTNSLASVLFFVQSAQVAQFGAFQKERFRGQRRGIYLVDEGRTGKFSWRELYAFL
jgi:hypothetical protein